MKAQDQIHLKDTWKKESQRQEMCLTSWVFQPQLLASKYCYGNGSLTIMDELVKDGFQPSPDLN